MKKLKHFYVVYIIVITESQTMVRHHPQGNALFARVFNFKFHFSPYFLIYAKPIFLKS